VPDTGFSDDDIEKRLKLFCGEDYQMPVGQMPQLGLKLAKNELSMNCYNKCLSFSSFFIFLFLSSLRVWSAPKVSFKGCP
jgi:hypothetical protein